MHYHDTERMHKKMDDGFELAGDGGAAGGCGGALRRRPSVGKIALLVFVVTSVVLFFTTHALKHFAEACEWMADHKLVAALILIPAEIVWVISGIPTTPIEIACGFVLGFPIGIVVNTIGKFTGCVLAFLLGKRWLRTDPAAQPAGGSGNGDGSGGGGGDVFSSDHILGRIVASGSDILRAIDVALTRDRAKGIRLLMLLQFAIIPVGIKNYGLAVTSVTLRDFAWTSLIGEIPGTLIYCETGASTANLVDVMEGNGKMSTGQVVVMIGGCVALVAVLVCFGVQVTRTLRREELREPVRTYDSDEEPGEPSSMVTMSFDGELELPPVVHVPAELSQAQRSHHERSHRGEGDRSGGGGGVRVSSRSARVGTSASVGDSDEYDYDGDGNRGNGGFRRGGRETQLV